MNDTSLPDVPAPRLDPNDATAQFAYTQSGAVYVAINGMLVRFRGHDIRAYRLISPISLLHVGRHLKASVLTEQGQPSSICSTRLVRVAEAPTRIGGRLNFRHMRQQEIRMYQAATALKAVRPLPS